MNKKLGQLYVKCVKKYALAFTLAEVLVTLAVIGVIASATLPSLIQNHKKHVVETRLKKFYSTINQAVQMAELEFGQKESWDIHGSALTGYEWFNKYLSKYIKTLKIEDSGNNTGDNNAAIVYFPDGSLSTFHTHGVNFYPSAKDYNTTNAKSGVTYFNFYYYPNTTSDANKFHKNKGVEPYARKWDGSMDNLINNNNYGCSTTKSSPAFCAKLIQINGWKIPKNYPFRF